MIFDIDAWVERSAIMEYDGGMSRFQAETLAARAQGLTRWQALEAVKHAKRIGHSAPARDHAAPHVGNGADNLPAMQPASAQQDGSLPKRDGAI